MGVPDLTHSLHMVAKEPRFLPSSMTPLISTALFCLHSEGGGGEVWRRYKLLLKSLTLEVTPITSAYTLLEFNHVVMPPCKGGWENNSGGKVSSIDHTPYFSALDGIFLGDTKEPSELPGDHAP